MVKYNYLTGHPNQIYYRLNAQISQLKRFYSNIKIGITGRPPEVRFDEHCKNFPWEKMLVIYCSTSERNVNILETKLINRYWSELVNQKPGGGSSVANSNEKWVYVLLKK